MKNFRKPSPPLPSEDKLTFSIGASPNTLDTKAS